MKKKSIFITATNTDVGKTFSAQKLLIKYANDGYKVGYYKPIETGVVDTPYDGSQLLELTSILNPDFSVNINDIVPYQFKLAAAPYVAKKTTIIDIDFIKQQKDYLFQFCDVLIIEGAGGVMVPLEKDYFIIDLIKDLNCDENILISPSKLGSINDTLLSMEALKRRDIAFKWYVNLFEDKESFEQVTLPFYKEVFKNIHYINDI
jgi:dethiobiotin synthetase